jgi:hypothetical protein
MHTDKKKLAFIRVHLCSSVAHNIFDVAQALVSAAPRLISARRVEMSLDPAGRSASATFLGA